MLTKYKLGDLIEVTRGMSLPSENYAEAGELIRLTLGNFNYNGGGFKDNTSKTDIFYIGEVKPEYILNKGDIITPLTEQTIGLLGSTAMIPESGKYIQSQDVALITPKEELLNHLFCYYLISSALVRKQLSVAAQQTKIRHTSPDKIKDCTVWIPNLSIQKSIGRTLYDIDKKIAINARMNAELEAMAKQLYDYWFVQFDFPDENGKPYKSSGGKMVWNEKLKREIPEGWEVKMIGDILDKVISTPRLTTDEYQTKGIYPIIDQATDIYFAGFTDRKDAVVEQYPAVIFGDHSCAVKYVNFPFVRGADGTQVMLSKVPEISIEYLYFVVKSIKVNKGYARHYSFIKDSPIIVPSIEISNKFKIITEKLYIQYKNYKLESIHLTHLRDSLLPMLMNGQVTIEENGK